MKNKIIVTGYFGAGNFGDDLMLEVFAKNIINHNLKVTFLKMQPEKINVSIPKSVKIIDISSYSRRVRQFILFFLMLKNDMFLWIGGTIFSDFGGEGEYGFMKLVNMMGKKFGYLGIGLTKLTLPKRIHRTKYVLENASIVTFRDKFSFKEADKYMSESSKKFLTADLVYLYKIEKNTEEIDQTIISWCALSKEMSEEDEKKAIEQLVSWLVQNHLDLKPIIVLPLHDGVDHEVNFYLYNYLKENANVPQNIKYFKYLTTQERAYLISISKNNISGRLHGVFLSEINRKNTVSMSYSIKMDEFLKSVGQLDDNVSVYNFNEEDLKQAFSSKKMISQNNLEGNIELAFKNIEYLLEFLKSEGK